MTQQRTDGHCEALIAACCRADARPPTFCSVMDGEIVATTRELREICADILSLRAAVRRVHAAEDAVKAAGNGQFICESWELLEEQRNARIALRAEMAGIDKDGGA